MEKEYVHQQGRARAIKALKDSMIRLSMSQNPSLTKSQQVLLSRKIDLHLPSLLPCNLRIPNHPPYAEMISIAIQELGKKKGSTKASISVFIKSRYGNLPVAHEELLSHHIQKLVSVGEIVAVTKSLYTLPWEEGDALNVPPLNASMCSLSDGWQNKEVDSTAVVPSSSQRQENKEADTSEIVPSPNKGQEINEVDTNEIVTSPNEGQENREVDANEIVSSTMEIDTNEIVPSPKEWQENREIDTNEIVSSTMEADTNETVTSTAIAHENDSEAVQGGVLNVPPLNELMSSPNEEGQQNKEVNSNIIIPSTNEGEENKEVDTNEIVPSTMENEIVPSTMEIDTNETSLSTVEVDVNEIVPSTMENEMVPSTMEIDANETALSTVEVDVNEIVPSTAIVLAHENDGKVAGQDSPLVIEAVKPLLKVFTRRAKVVVNTSDIDSSNNVVVAIENGDNVAEHDTLPIIENVVLAIENGDNVAEQDTSPMVETVKPLLKTFSRRRGRGKPADDIVKEEEKVEVKESKRSRKILSTRRIFSRKGRKTLSTRRIFSRKGRGKPAEKYTL